jgi:hypothetical protein
MSPFGRWASLELYTTGTGLALLELARQQCPLTVMVTQ